MSTITLAFRFLLPFMIGILPLTFGLCVFAQTPSITHYGMEDGLSSGDILNIYQDQKGYIWVSTYNGLHRFDGKEWRTFSTKHGVMDVGFNQIYESKDGNIYFGFNRYRRGRLNQYNHPHFTHQVMSYNGRQWRKHAGEKIDHWSFGRLDTNATGHKWFPMTPHADQINLETILQFNQPKNKNSWGTPQAIYTESPEHFYVGAWKSFIECKGDTCIDHLQHHYSGSTAQIRQIEKAKDLFWLSTDEGIKVFDGERFLEDMVPKDLQRDIITSMKVDHKQRVWFSTILGLYCYNGEEFKQYTTKHGLPHNRLGNLNIDRQNRLWLSVREGLGLYKLAQDSIQLIAMIDTTIQGSHNGYRWFVPRRVVFEDYEGNIWFDTADGIACLRNFDFAHYEPKHTNTSKWVAAAVMDTNQNIWMGTWEDGITVCPTNGKDTCWQYNTNNRLLSDQIFRLITDDSGAIWMGTDKGLIRHDQNGFTSIALDDSTFQQLTELTTLPDQTTSLSTGVYRLLAAQGNAIYFVQNGVVLRYHPAKQHFKIIPFKTMATTLQLDAVASALYHPVVHLLYEDQNDTIWAYHDEGLFRLEQDTFRLVGSKNYLGVIVDMAQDEQGNFWMVDQEKGGLIRYDGKYAIRFDERDGLSTNQIRSITIQEGYAYLGTTKGIDRLNVRLFNEQEIVAIKNIGIAEGFTPLSCGYLNYRSPQGNIWLNSKEGISCYHINNNRPVHPKLQVTDIFLHHEPVDWITFVDSLNPQTHLPKQLALGHQENTLTFEYRTITTQNPQNIYYQYQLEGIDTTWQLPTKHHLATYANLPAGDYTFKVQATNQLPYWTQTPQVFSFTVVSAVWQRNWFMLLMSVVGISCLLVWSWGVYWLTKRYCF